MQPANVGYDQFDQAYMPPPPGNYYGGGQMPINNGEWRGRGRSGGKNMKLEPVLPWLIS